jgi:hypothetical protein
LQNLLSPRFPKRDRRIILPFNANVKSDGRGSMKTEESLESGDGPKASL